MSDPFYTVTRLNERAWRITSAEAVYMDLVVGDRRALLLDTGYGFGDLKSVVEGITSLPLTVVNSHGHFDHVCGDSPFGAACIHPLDLMLCRASNAPDARRKMAEQARSREDPATGQARNILPPGFDPEAYAAAPPPRLCAVEEGARFDLGGVTLEVVRLPGHTPGSIGLLWREEGLFYVGDAMNPFLWLFFPEALPLSAYMDTLHKAMGLDFTHMVQSHNPRIVPKADLSYYLDCAETLDYAAARPFLPIDDAHPGTRMWVRPGFRWPEEMEREGFAAILISPEQLERAGDG